TVVNVLKDIGQVKVKQSNFDGAHDDFSRAVALLQQYDPLNHSQLVNDLEWIVSIWKNKQCYRCAIEYLQQCLHIKEASLSPEHLSIAATLLDLAHVHRIRDEYQLSLIYEMKYYSIIEKVFSPDHEDIIDSLANIAQCYEDLDERQIALKYYQQILTIYEQSESVSDFEIFTVMDKIELLTEQINEELI
ncbi:unnamed protein product, partial [Adineta steineri]